jgi:pilus assembly protein CpaE
VTAPRILVLERSEALVDQIRMIAADLPAGPEVVMCNRVGAVGELLEDDGPYDLLIAGPSLGTRSGLARLEVIHQEIPAMGIILAFSARPAASLREIVRAGAIDVIQLPATDEELAASVERALEFRRKLMVPAHLAANADGARLVGSGSVLTVSSATGGCGKTFYATNLAYFLAHQTGRRVCIIDLDLQFGEISTALRLRPSFTICDALSREDTTEADLHAHIEEYLVQHDCGIWVLAAPKDPAEADRITPTEVSRIVEVLRSRFDYVVVDTPAQLSETVLAAFDLSETIFTMATLDLPSVRNMSVFLATLEKLKISASDVLLILNKAESDVGIDVSEIEKLFPKGFRTVLPYAKEVSRSINLGVPVMASSPTAEISRKMAQGMLGLLPQPVRTRVRGRADGFESGLFSRLFRRQPRPAPGMAELERSHS